MRCYSLLCGWHILWFRPIWSTDLQPRSRSACATRHCSTRQFSDFIQEGHLGRHLRRMRELYAERLGVLIESARENLAGLLEISSVEAGLQTVGWLAGGINAERAARKAAQLDVEVIPLSRYTSRAFGREGLILGFAAVDARELRRGTEQLARALRGG